MSILSRALEAIHFAKHNAINLAEPEQALHEAESGFKQAIVSEVEQLHLRLAELESKISPVTEVPMLPVGVSVSDPIAQPVADALALALNAGPQ